MALAIVFFSTTTLSNKPETDIALEDVMELSTAQSNGLDYDIPDSLTANSLPYEIIPFGRYDHVSFLGDYHLLSFMADEQDNIVGGVTDLSGNEIFPFSSHYNTPSVVNGKISIRDGSQLMVFNEDMELIASFNGALYQSVEYVTDNRFILTHWDFFTDGRDTTIVVDAAGNPIISPRRGIRRIDVCDQGRWFKVDSVFMNEGIAVFDANGNVVIPFGLYDDIQFIPGDRFAVMTTGSWDDAEFAILDHNRHEVIPFGVYRNFRAIGDGHLIARYDNRWGIVDAYGNQITGFVYSGINTECGYVLVVNGNNHRVGVISAHGEEIIPFDKYNLIQVLSDDRFLVLRNATRGAIDFVGGEWGVVSAVGNEIIPFGEYDNILVMGTLPWRNTFLRFNYGILVTAGEYVGLKCINGQELIPVGKYDFIHGTRNGIAIVEYSEDIGVIRVSIP